MSEASELEAGGWERRSVLCEPRLSECVELYRELGFEVKLAPLDPQGMPEGCGACYEKDIDKYRIVYVRQKE
jgi:hypothetical protein